MKGVFLDQLPPRTCDHSPLCPGAEDHDRGEARIVSAHPEQGWNLRCNGILSFEDNGQLLPDGTVIASQRPVGLDRTAA
ncbi:DUF5999 family protein [Streptomyces sp. H27-H1]|uniref:DUF5999 family protein n=1 Tax=Streptomyces sp. H27-H1 TaxID=2996461 RepID=UPI00226E9E6D|nr:DUF5999 family protein [Streptomyces sp. H27-H1]MCY0929499.1 DUF5999 family protein [Streptomyces sp. H27-H1]